VRSIMKVYWFSGDGLYGNALGDPDWPQTDASISAQNHGAREYALAYLRDRHADRRRVCTRHYLDEATFRRTRARTPCKMDHRDHCREALVDPLNAGSSATTRPPVATP